MGTSPRALVSLQANTPRADHQGRMNVWCQRPRVCVKWLSLRVEVVPGRKPVQRTKDGPMEFLILSLVILAVVTMIGVVFRMPKVAPSDDATPEAPVRSSI